MSDVSTGFIRLTVGVIGTIVDGVLTATQTQMIVAAESGGGGIDDLATINIDTTLLMPAGYTELLLLKADAGDTITVKHGTGNVSLAGGADFTLTGEKTLALVRMSADDDWNDLAGSN